MNKRWRTRGHDETTMSFVRKRRHDALEVRIVGEYAAGAFFNSRVGYIYDGMGQTARPIWPSVILREHD